MCPQSDPSVQVSKTQTFPAELSLPLSHSPQILDGFPGSVVISISNKITIWNLRRQSLLKEDRSC